MSTKVGGEILVNTTTDNYQGKPSIAALTDGGYVVTWQDASASGGDTSGAAVRAQRCDAGGNKVGGELLVNTTTSDFQWQPSAAALADGGFVITWIDESGTGGDTDGRAIRGQRYDSNSAKAGGEFLVNTTTAGDQNETSVAGLAGGGFVVVWTDDSETGGDTDGEATRGQLFNASGAKVGSEFLVNTTTAGNQDYCHVAALTGGGFVVVWDDDSASSGDTDGGAVRGQVYDASGAKVGGEFLANTTTGGNQDFSHVTALADGGFVAVWQDDSGADDDIRGQRFDSTGTKVGGEFIANTTTTVDLNDPVAAGTADGGFVVSWRDSGSGDGDGRAVIAQVFDATGIKDGGEVLVNTTTADDQDYPSAAGSVDGGFMIAWTDRSQIVGDTTDQAVRAQIFNDPPVIISNGGGPFAAIDLMENTLSITTVMATDNDSVPAYSIDGGADAGLFEINPTTGALSFKVAPDFESPADGNTDNIYDVIVQASDGISNDTQSLAVTVTNLPDAPPVITSNGGGAAASISLLENSTAVTKVTASTPEGGPPSFAITAGADAALFAIDIATGMLSFKAAPDFEAPADSNGDNVYEVTVKVSDGVLGDVQSLSIGVTDESDPQPQAGTKGNNQLSGTAEADTLLGKKGKDVLTGLAGDDILNGGKHKDNMTGGEGADSFVFDSKLKNKWADKITDFESAVDVISLDNKIFKNIGGEGDLKGKYFDSGKEADSKKDRLLLDKKGWLRFDQDGNKNGHEAIKVVKLGKEVDLTADDFMII